MKDMQKRNNDIEPHNCRKNSMSRILTATISFTILAIVATAGHAQESAPAVPTPGVVAGDALIKRIAALAKSGKINLDTVQKMIDVPVQFSQYTQFSKDTWLGEKHRIYSLARRQEQIVFSDFIFRQEFKESEGGERRGRTSVSFDLNPQKQDEICISAASIKREVGRKLESRFMQIEFLTEPLRFAPFALSYTEAGGLLSISFSFYSPCASSVAIWDDRASEWPKGDASVAANAEFIRKFLPLDPSGSQLTALGFQCQPYKRSAIERDGTICSCPEKSASGDCHYEVDITGWESGDILTYVREKKQP
jgi:hypothetical protein